MNSRSILVGTCEAKRPYQRNLALGFGVSGMAHVIAVSTIFIFMTYTPKTEIFDLPRVPTGIEVIPPPVVPKPIPGPVNPVKPTNAPTTGIPTPVSDDEALAESVIPTQDELSILAPDTPPELLETNIVADPAAVLKEILPDPGTFVSCQEFPVIVNAVTPTYPDLARRTGIEGIVWVNALIDKEGRVRDAIIAKPSGADIGFEEAAIEAALASSWKPAVANGMPVAIWVTYKVEFKLK